MAVKQLSYHSKAREYLLAGVNILTDAVKEKKEKKTRVENALHATLAAQEEGFVPGGGVALIRSQTYMDLCAQFILFFSYAIFF